MLQYASNSAAIYTRNASRLQIRGLQLPIVSYNGARYISSSTGASSQNDASPPSTSSVAQREMRKSKPRKLSQYPRPLPLPYKFRSVMLPKSRETKAKRAAGPEPPLSALTDKPSFAIGQVNNLRVPLTWKGAAIWKTARPGRLRIRSVIQLKTQQRNASEVEEPQETLDSDDSTIYALSSAPGRAGIAVIRVSGPACLDIYKAICKSSRVPELPVPRHAYTHTLYDPTEQTRKILDTRAMVLYFEPPGTQTGQDMLEFHTHGGNATVKAVLNAISKVESRKGGTRRVIRYAEAGEFTRRAFYNNKLDLSQVESLSDQLSAETEQQRQAAVRGTSKFLGTTYEEWRQTLLGARGEMEALIDFSEDQHFDESPAELLKGVNEKVVTMLKAIDKHEWASHCGELIRQGIRISLLGPPNVGKSSLLNRIVGREASIVSHEAGTTRDVVEVILDIGGYLCTFADTAGLREGPEKGDNITMDPIDQAHQFFSKAGSISTSNENEQELNIARRTPIYEGKATENTKDALKSYSKARSASTLNSVEQEGIRRARAKAADSDLIIALGSVEPSPKSPLKFDIHFDPESLVLAASAPEAIVVVNKCDRVSKHTLQELLADFKEWTIPFRGDKQLTIVPISCHDAAMEEVDFGKGLTKVKDSDSGNIRGLTDVLVSTFKEMTELPVHLQELVGVTERSRQLLVRAARFLNYYLKEALNEDDVDLVIAAENLREAARSIALISGKGDAGDVEEVLGVVFEKFCVGK